MPLSDVQIRSAKPVPDKVPKLSDGGGLQLWVTPTGSKLWNLAYRYEGKQKKLSLGTYPAVGLKAARQHRDASQALLASGIDPGQHKKANRIEKANAGANTFEAIAGELIAKKLAERLSDTTLTKARWLLDFAKPTLGSRPIATIKAPEILAVLRAVESRGRHETATRLRSTIGEVFRYAIATGRAEDDPTYALRGALIAPTVTPRAALTEPKAFGGLLRSIAVYDGSPEVRAALQLLALTFVRPGELRGATWSEIDLDEALWTIPAARMKMRRPHLVPLAPQAVALLRDLHTITGAGALVFPSVRSSIRPISEGTLNAALRRLGYGPAEMTGHGFRAAASTILNSTGLWPADAIEAQLAHVDPNKVRRAYNRAAYWDQRVPMMSAWADQIEAMRDGAQVIPLRA